MCSDRGFYFSHRRAHSRDASTSSERVQERFSPGPLAGDSTCLNMGASNGVEKEGVVKSRMIRFKKRRKQ